MPRSAAMTSLAISSASRWLKITALVTATFGPTRSMNSGSRIPRMNRSQNRCQASLLRVAVRRRRRSAFLDALLILGFDLLEGFIAGVSSRSLGNVPGRSSTSTSSAFPIGLAAALSLDGGCCRSAEALCDSCEDDLQIRRLGSLCRPAHRGVVLEPVWAAASASKSRSSHRSLGPSLSPVSGGALRPARRQRLWGSMIRA